MSEVARVRSEGKQGEKGDHIFFVLHFLVLGTERLAFFFFYGSVYGHFLGMYQRGA